MGEQERRAERRWRRIEAIMWEHELRTFGPLPRTTRTAEQGRDRTLWQLQAYAMIERSAHRARRRAALQARRHGATYAQIGAALGISRQAARKLVDRATPKPARGYLRNAS